MFTKWILPFRHRITILCPFLISSICATYSAHPWFDRRNNIWYASRLQIVRLVVMHFVPLLLHLSQYFSQHHFWDFFNLRQNKHPLDLFRGPSAVPFLSGTILYIFLAREEWEIHSLIFSIRIFFYLPPPREMWTQGLFNLSKQVSCSKSTPIYSRKTDARGEFRDFTNIHRW
jgi:hypothetical protein